MPLKFLQSIKAKKEKLKNKSKSTTDLLQGRQQLSTESAQMFPTETGFKKKSQSKPYLRYSSKDSGQVTVKKSKEYRDKSCPDFTETKKAESQTSCPDSDAGHSLRTDEDNCDQNGNTLSVPQPRSSRSSSCFSVADGPSRERRLSDIALLDQYIGYHQRRAADDGNNTNRLVCAQLLRESFVRLEQMHLSDTLRSNSKHDLSRSVSNLNQLPAYTPRQPQYQKNNQRRLSSVVGLSQHYEPRLSVCNADIRKSWTSVDLDNKEEDGPIQFSCNVDSDTVFTENDRDITKRRSSLDNFNFRDLFKKPKAMTKRRSVPSFKQQEIEIF